MSRYYFINWSTTKYVIVSVDFKACNLLGLYTLVITAQTRQKQAQCYNKLFRSYFSYQFVRKICHKEPLQQCLDVYIIFTAHETER